MSRNNNTKSLVRKVLAKYLQPLDEVYVWLNGLIVDEPLGKMFVQNIIQQYGDYTFEKAYITNTLSINICIKKPE